MCRRRECPPIYTPLTINPISVDILTYICFETLLPPIIITLHLLCDISYSIVTYCTHMSNSYKNI